MKLKLNTQKIAFIVVVLFIIIGVLIVALDWNEVRRLINQAKWPLLIPSLVFMVISYTCLSFSSALVYRTFGIKLNFRDLLQIGFVGNVATYLMNVGGITGVSLEFVLMKKRGLVTQDILAPSLFELYFSSVVLIALLPTGFFIIVADPSISSGTRLGFGIAAGILVSLLVLTGFIVVRTSVRKTIFRGLNRTFHFVTHRDIISQLNDFDIAMTRGVSVIQQRPFILGILLLLSIGDWVATVTCLWFCFYALGNTIGIGILLTGFSLGITAGFLSLVPGGLGIQEGSMTGVLVLLGVPINSAFLAAILFRVTYYFVPFLISLIFYRRLLRAS